MPLDISSASMAELAALQARLSEEAKAASQRLDDFNSAVEDRFLTQIRTAQRRAAKATGKLDLDAGEGVLLSFTQSESITWDDAALAALHRSEPRLRATIRTKFDVLKSALDACPADLREDLMACGTIKSGKPKLTLTIIEEGSK